MLDDCLVGGFGVLCQPTGIHRSLGILDHPKVFCEHNITLSDRLIMEYRRCPWLLYTGCLKNVG